MASERTILAQLSIDAESQADFARLSGDHNPIHVDPHAGRRSAFGEVVVHGLNTLLSALEACVANGSLPTRGWSRLQVQFLKPVFVAEAIDIVCVSRDDQRVRLVVRTGEADLVKITLAGDAGAETAFEPGEPLRGPERMAPPFASPRERHIEDGEGFAGALPLAVDAALLNARYPHLVAWLGERRTAGLALLSTVVGMEWPGAHSLFTEARVVLTPSMGEQPKDVTFHVTSADPDKAVTSCSVEAPGLTAELTAFFRPAPVEQLAASDFRGRLPGRPFEGSTAFVVGGSRGLGAIAAQLLAAGGADLVLSYRSASAEAEAVADSIRELGARCEVVQFTVGGELPLPPLSEPKRPVLLLYFASPHIFRRRTQRYSRAWLDEFLDVYVDAFIETVQGVCKWTQGPVAVLYPSTEALDRPIDQIIEYAAAKAAGEAVSQALAASDRRLSIEMPRLPRLLTDQTNSIVKVETEDPIDILEPILMRLLDGIRLKAGAR
jgi:acyl dehydratase/NADP-dependent 3-hydroxy acid dehydrogenase YdfG